MNELYNRFIEAYHEITKYLKPSAGMIQSKSFFSLHNFFFLLFFQSTARLESYLEQEREMPTLNGFSEWRVLRCIPKDIYEHVWDILETEEDKETQISQLDETLQIDTENDKESLNSSLSEENVGKVTRAKAASPERVVRTQEHKEDTKSSDVDSDRQEERKFIQDLLHQENSE